MLTPLRAALLLPVVVLSNSVLLHAETRSDSAALLKTFREEFVSFTPGQGDFPRAFRDSKGKEVAVDHAFKIAAYEVPQNLWEAVMGNNPSRWRGMRNAVEMFTLAEAKAFCEKATVELRRAHLIDDGEEIRLPTEAEWEYAARAGSTTNYNFGDDAADLEQYAWFHGNAAGNDPAVGVKKPNAWGLYDTHGYLWEMCDNGVARGGSWKDGAEKLTFAARMKIATDLKDDALGLRCVLAKVGKTAATAVIKPTSQAKFIAPDAKFEVVWGGGEFTEGPAVAPDGQIFFSDIGNIIYRFDPRTRKTVVERDPSGRSNGLAFDSQGRLFAAEGANTGGSRRISVTESSGEVRTLADRFDGKRFNSPNDLALDSHGNVYFTDPRYVGNEPRELDFEAVFFVSAAGEVKVATREAMKPNGIVVSPDGQQCYVAESDHQGKRQLLRFDVQSDGTLANTKVLHDFGAGRGIDGMTIDLDGNIYATAGAGDVAGIYVFSPTGELLAWFLTPGDPTNCEFGAGDERHVLYVTSALPGKPAKYGLARITLLKAGRK